MSTPYDHYFWQLREIQRTLDSLRPSLDAIETASSAFYEAFEQMNSLADRFTLPNFYLEELERIQNSFGATPAIEQLQLLGSRELQLLEDFRLSQDRLNQLAVEVMGALLSKTDFHVSHRSKLWRSCAVSSDFDAQNTRIGTSEPLRRSQRPQGAFERRPDPRQRAAQSAAPFRRPRSFAWLLFDRAAQGYLTILRSGFLGVKASLRVAGISPSAYWEAWLRCCSQASWNVQYSSKSPL